MIEVARWVKDALDELGLHAGPEDIRIERPARLSALPPDTPNDAATSSRNNCHESCPSASEVATIERAVKARGATTVYVDYLQNIIGKTVAGAYSARANPDAMVSTPLEWDELTDDLDPRDFTIETAPARFAEVGDIWAAAMKKPNSLKALS